MASILEFRRPDDRPARAASDADGAQGEIIIFPGVRIERQDLGGTPQGIGAPPRKRAQRRRRR
jgi:hypothetical protein